MNIIFCYRWVLKAQHTLWHGWFGKWLPTDSIDISVGRKSRKAIAVALVYVFRVKFLIFINKILKLLCITFFSFYFKHTLENLRNQILIKSCRTLSRLYLQYYWFADIYRDFCFSNCVFSLGFNMIVTCFPIDNHWKPQKSYFLMAVTLRP